MKFDEWWSRHAINKSDILPILKMSFKELAKSAWEAALYSSDVEICEGCNRDKDYCLCDAFK